MDSIGVIIALFIVHAFLFVAVFVNVVDSSFFSKTTKFFYIIIALTFPILGPIIINILLGERPVQVSRMGLAASQPLDESQQELRDWLEENTKSSNSSLGDINSSNSSSYTGGDSGGGGD